MVLQTQQVWSTEMKRALFVLSGTALILIAAMAHPKAEIASWYASGHTTANGERFRPDGLTAAHRSLPFGTMLAVTYRGRRTVVRVNDRGPFVRGRHVDLSRGAARAIGCTGVCHVQLKVL